MRAPGGDPPVANGEKISEFSRWSHEEHKKSERWFSGEWLHVAEAKNEHIDSTHARTQHRMSVRKTECSGKKKDGTLLNRADDSQNTITVESELEEAGLELRRRSAVSTSPIVIVGSSSSISQDLQVLHTFASLQSQKFSFFVFDFFVVCSSILQFKLQFSDLMRDT